MKTKSMNKHSNLDINECRGVTCQNEGRCWNQLGYFYCQCPLGFGGRFCENGESLYIT